MAKKKWRKYYIPKPPKRKSRAKRTKRKPKYRVRNWREYNAALVRRGSISVWIDTENLTAWRAEPTGQRGHPSVYSDAAIECLLLVRVVYHLTLRATQGFAQAFFTQLGLALPVPDYTTLCRRARTLRVALPRQAGGKLHLVLDSSGLKVFGEGEWKVRTHGKSKRRTWREFHLSVDLASRELQAVTLCPAGSDEAKQVEHLLPPDADIEEVIADGVYDTRLTYQVLLERRIPHVIIPPRRGARVWQHGNCQAPPHPRDEHIRYIRRHGRKRWKRDTGYHRRSLAETTIFRLKHLFGARLHSRLMPQQTTETRLRCAALNRMTHLGMPHSYKVAA